jgi:alpha-D-ribose 1-methylphosphonate 5-triphosphate synthase subunit PhnG
MRPSWWQTGRRRTIKLSRSLDNLTEDTVTSQTIPGETRAIPDEPRAIPDEAPDGDIADRQRWMRTLALADSGALAAAWAGFEPKPAVQAIRGPEAGLVMVRGRIDGGGARFNLGEATVARATLRLHGTPLADDTVGTSYVLGTDLEHARLAAVFDGLLCDAGLRERVLAEVIAPLAAAQAGRDDERLAEARSTTVNFFTVSREHE